MGPTPHMGILLNGSAMCVIHTSCALYIIVIIDEHFYHLLNRVEANEVDEELIECARISILNERHGHP